MLREEYPSGGMKVLSRTQRETVPWSFFFQEFVFKDIKHFPSYCLPFFRSGWMGNEAFLRVACGQRVDSMLGIFPWSIT